MRYLLISLLGILAIVGCGRTPNPLEGTWATAPASAASRDVLQFASDGTYIETIKQVNISPDLVINGTYSTSGVSVTFVTPGYPDKTYTYEVSPTTLALTANSQTISYTKN